MPDPRTALRWLREPANGQAVRELCARFDVELLVAHGSATRAEDTTASPQDLDLAVRFTRHGDVIELTTALIGVLHLDAVDVMDLAAAGIVARKNALALGIPIFERQPGAFARAQMAAISQWMDTRWLRRMSLEQMAS